MRLFAFSFALPMLAGAATTVVGFHYLSPSDPAISLSPQEPPSQPRSGAFQEDFAPKARMRTAEGSAVASPPAQERQKHSSRPEVAADEAADEPAALKAPRAGLREAERTGEPRVEEKKSKHHSSRSRSSKPRSASDENEAQLMLEALRARRGGDHERAARLLARYRKEHPQGSLSEEALALSLEAAVARGDHDQARRLAARYLELHPGGRFRSKAQKFVKTRP